MLSKRIKPLLIIVLLTLLLLGLFACSTSSKAIGFTVDGEFKTKYLIGETADYSGMKITVAYDDGTVKVFDAYSIMSELKFVNFNTFEESLSKPVTVEYKKFTAVFYIEIISEINSRIEFDVTFETNGAKEDIAPIKVVALTTIPVPDDPQKDGYFFDGWYQEASLTNKWNFNTTKITKNTTLYAKWGNLLKVYFADENGVVFENLTRTDVREGYTYLNRPAVPEKTGFNGSWEYYGEWDDLYNGQIIKAKYTDKMYTVTFYYINELGDSRTYTLGGEYKHGSNVNELAAGELSTLIAIFENTRPNTHLYRWYLGDYYTDSTDFSPLLTYITNNLEIRAEYAADIMEVTFDYGGGNLVVVPVAYGSPLSRPASSTTDKAGYEFDGWFNLNTLWKFESDLVRGNITLTARWTKQYTVTFHNFDGSVYETRTVREGGTLAAANIPKPPEYSLDGYNTSWDTIEYTNITSDRNVYPNYSIKVYEVRFVDYDNTPILVNGQAVQNISHGGQFVFPLTNPSRTNYDFVSWNVNESDINRVTSNLTIVALYTKKLYRITIIHGPSGETSYIDVGAGDSLNEADLPMPLSTERKKFGGWFTDSGLTTAWNESMIFNAPTTIYSKWNNAYLVTFSYRESATSDDRTQKQVYVIENQKVTPVELVKLTGLTGEWTINSQAVDFNSLIITADLTIIAEYKTAIYTVIFMNEGTAFYTTRVMHGGTVSRPSDEPQKTGYTFKYWSNYTADKKIEEDTTFGAYFERNIYTVTFIIQPDSTFDAVTYIRNVSYESSALVPENPDYQEYGYRFTGWDKSYSRIVADTVINAMFEKIKYTVTFISTIDNDKLYAQEVTYGDYVTEPEIPVVSGYTFVEWDYDFTDPVPVTGPLNILAYFKINAYEITLNTAGGSFTAISSPILKDGDKYYVLVDYNKSFKLNNEPLLAGMAFMGWYTTATYQVMYDFNKPVTSSLTIYARWEIAKSGSEGLEYVFDSVKKTVTVVSAPADAENIEIASHRMFEGISYKVVAIASLAFKNMTSLKSVIIPDTVVDIGSGAFIGCTGLTSVTIPKSVERIAENAFIDCVNLKNVNFEANSTLKSIGKAAFFNNSSIAAIDLPLSVTEIGSDAFGDCISLMYIVIPQNVIEIGERAFLGCINLKYAKFMPDTSPNLGVNAFMYCPDYFRAYVGVLSNYSSTSNRRIGWKELIDKGIVLTLSSITENGEWSYKVVVGGEDNGTVEIIQYLGNETSIKLYQIEVSSGTFMQISAVGAHAFNKQITEIEFATDIRLNANSLSSAIGLERLILVVKPKFILSKDVLYKAFELSGLNELTVSANGLTLWEIFGRAAPSSLEIINIKDDADSITLADGMFNNNYFIKKVTLPSSVVSIGAEAFINCKALTEVIIENQTSKLSKLKVIGAKAFYGAENLITISIPNTVTTIGIDAFHKTAFLNNNTSEFIIYGDGILYKYQNVGKTKVEFNQIQIKTINAEAFKNNTFITGVVFTWNIQNSNLVEIGDNAFEECINLEYVVMPVSLQKIGKNAFLNASKLSKVILFSTTEITGGENMFQGTLNGFEVFAAFEKPVASAWNSVTSFTRIFNPTITVSSWVYSTTSDLGRLYLLQSVSDSATVTLPTEFNLIPIFYYANFLTLRATQNLTVPVSVIKDGDTVYEVTYNANTFSGLSNLKTLTLQNTQNIAINTSPNLKNILLQILKNNQELTKLIVPGDVSIEDIFGTTDLPQYLTTVEIAEGSLNIADEMFKNCTFITDIIFPESLQVDGVGRDAFSNSGYEASFTDDYVYIDSLKLLVSYKGKENIIRIPQNIEYINRYALYQNEFVEIIILPDSIKEIYEYAFASMKLLIKIIVEERDDTITAENDIFNAENNVGLELFVDESFISSYLWNNIRIVSNKDVIFDFDNGIIYRILDENNIELLQYFVKLTCASVKSAINIGGTEYTVAKLGANVFFNAVTNITLDASIGLTQYTFSNLKNVEKLALLNVSMYKDDISTIDAAWSAWLRAFINSNIGLKTLAYDASIKLSDLLGTTSFPSHLTTIEILENTTHITGNMLNRANFISQITILDPDSIKEIGNNAFEGTAWYNAQGDYVLLLGGTFLYKYKGTSSSIVIPQQIKIINEYAFSNYSYENGNDVWRGISNLTTVNFQPGSLAKEIRNRAFYLCEKLTKIDITDSMEKIAHNAFEGTLIKEDSEGYIIATGDNSQTIIKYNGTKDKVEIPAGIKYINYEAFKDNEDIKELSFLGTFISKIGESAFENCVNLTDVNIGRDSLITNIGKDAFKNTHWFDNTDTSLVTENSSGVETLLLYLGQTSEPIVINGEEGELSNITVITSGAFKSVTGEFDVKFTKELPAVLNAGALDNVRFIYVPEEYLSLYKSAWTAYSNKIIAY